MSFKFKHPIVIITITLFSLLSIQAQKGFDLSSVNYTNMTNNQLQQLFQEASSKGYNYNDILKAAEAQGLTAEEIDTLDKRFNSLNTRASKNSNIPNQESRLRNTNYSDISLQESQLGNLNNDGVEYPKMKSDLFGFDVFKGNSLLTFQSNLNIPTPAGYILGSGDKLFIDIYGQSEAYYQIEISPEGTIILENFGPIHLSGLTVENATKRIENRLSKVYLGINGDKKNTFVNVSVGKSRTIKVNIVGEVDVPGSYTLSAFNSVYNALYVAGGITENATLRDVKVYRNNKLISKVDIYKYLTAGDASGDIALENNDLILVKPYTNRVTLNGAVKIEGRFELLKNESLQDLLNYASGFNEQAYTKTIKVKRVSDGEHIVADINKDQFEIFTPKSGDVFQVDKVLDRYKNRVIVNGAVYRPGVYAITKGLGVKGLLAKTEGLKQDALTTTANIIRTNEDLSTSSITFNLRDVLSGKNQDILLQKEDVLTITSKNEIKEDDYVEIAGAVNQPGIYTYSKGMKLKDLILKARGFNKTATETRVEISRKLKDSNADNSKLSQVIVVDISKEFDDLENENNIMLSPFDHITVRTNPNFKEKQFVFVDGQVNYPGLYAIESKSERVSDLLKRSGGVNEFAYPNGATLIRKTEYYKKETEFDKQQTTLLALKENLITETDSLSEFDSGLLKRINSDLDKLSLLTQEEKNILNKSTNFTISAKKDSLQPYLLPKEELFNTTESIAIDLSEIIKNNGSISDLLVQSGDTLFVPKKLETVRLRGELLNPTTVRHQNNKTTKYYINNAGGFKSRADKSKTYVIYPNGLARATKKFLFFNIYPKVVAGSEIIVPQKLEKKSSLGIGNLTGIFTTVATLVLAITQIK
ncbi:SLBB domain-containing protein [Flavobacteriaceae bacterium]|nr:SLBB domain-containing protein [Flavobacteriaceae bacterium]